jgi:aspartate-semialdehyde dehydrogenase
MNEARLRRSPSVAIVGSSSLLGKELKEMLEDGAFPLSRLVLLETEEYAGLLQEFANEIQITQIISPASLEDVDIAFFACGPDIMKSYLESGAGFPDLTIDLTQAGRSGILYLSGVSDTRMLRPRGYFTNPHPATIVIVRTLSRLHSTFGVESAAVTIMEPASERGSAGVDELQEQTVNLLNFQHVEKKVFQGQLAFNVLPENEASERTENRILQQITTVLGKAFSSPKIIAIQAPIFHSHAFSLFVELMAKPRPEEVLALMRKDSGCTLHDSPGDPSPVGVVGTDRIHIGRVRELPHHEGAYALWLVADNLRIAASNAIQTAEQIMLATAVEG